MSPTPQIVPDRREPIVKLGKGPVVYRGPVNPGSFKGRLRRRVAGDANSGDAAGRASNDAAESKRGGVATGLASPTGICTAR